MVLISEVKDDLEKMKTRLACLFLSAPTSELHFGWTRHILYYCSAT
jgi:hypothetical protein